MRACIVSGICAPIATRYMPIADVETQRSCEHGRRSRTVPTAITRNLTRQSRGNHVAISRNQALITHNHVAITHNHVAITRNQTLITHNHVAINRNQAVITHNHVAITRNHVAKSPRPSASPQRIAPWRRQRATERMTSA